MKLLFRTLVGLMLIASFNSCKHDNFSEFVGPALCPTNNFTITQPFSVSSSSIDFTTFPGNHGDSIKATFSEEVTWTVKITGNSSGATKIYRGRTAKIDTVWFGQSNSPNATFSDGEQATIELSISCLSQTYAHTVTIVKANRFDSSIGPFVLISDFEGSGSVTNIAAFNSYNEFGWSSYYSKPNLLTKFDIGSNVSTLAAPNGSNYITIQGVAGPSSWFVGGMYAVGPPSMPAGNNNSNDTYFNAFMSSGDNKTTTVGITLIVSGIKYSNILPISWTGWKMVSIKLSDFKDGDGNSLPDPSGLAYNRTTHSGGTMDFGLNCATAQGQSNEFDMDYIVFSSGGPFFQ